ncbi:GlsB/YeaQ/YmgE family stress response membrane protein [Salmonella enterica]|nr:GlsB/YeaQ/YmgE family stress response membrane protein [Salmonella enterica]
MRRSTLPILKTFLLERGFANGIIAWIVFGLIAGVIAKLLMPGRDGGGFILTCILGIVGAVVGGWLATMFGIGGSISGFNLHSFLVAVVGAIVVLVIFRLLRRG